MFSTSEDGTVGIWQVGKWECLKTLKGHKWVGSCSLSVAGFDHVCVELCMQNNRHWIKQIIFCIMLQYKVTPMYADEIFSKYTCTTLGRHLRCFVISLFEIVYNVCCRYTEAQYTVWPYIRRVNWPCRPAKIRHCERGIWWRQRQLMWLISKKVSVWII